MMRTHGSPLSVLRHYAILFFLVAVVVVAAYALVDIFFGLTFRPID